MRGRTSLLAALVAAMLLAPAAAAVGKGGPPPGKGPGGGEETAGNNLSDPAVLVGTTGAPTLVYGCDGQLHEVIGEESEEFPGYWLQKTAGVVWQAECNTANSATVALDWGDNLTLAPSLGARPIRVEVNLFALDEYEETITGAGYLVVNLTPELLDRYAIFGTDKTVTEVPARAFVEGSSLRIEALEDGEPSGVVVYDGAMPVEINSFGRVVYGYNWGTNGRKNAPAPGEYRLTFTIGDGSTIASCEEPGALNTPVCVPGGNTSTLDVSITSGKPGGGGHSHD